MMDTDQAFKSITENIKKGNNQAVRSEIDSIISSTDDVMLMIKCASILKTINDEDGCQKILDSVIENAPDDIDSRYDVGISIRSLGRPVEAYDLMSGKADDDERRPEIARTLMLIGRYEEGLALLEDREDASVKDRILHCELLTSLKRYDEAYEEAKVIADDDNSSYISMVNLITVMMVMGKDKEAMKLAKSNLKDDKKNVDSLALEAFVMWVNGRYPAAMNYANKALRIDYTHSGALEIMAMCLIIQKKFVQAKMLAGVINENDPTNPAIIRILDACRLASKV